METRCPAARLLVAHLSSYLKRARRPPASRRLSVVAELNSVVDGTPSADAFDGVGAAHRPRTTRLQVSITVGDFSAKR